MAAGGVLFGYCPPKPRRGYRAAIGGGTPEARGTCRADPSRRVVLLAGEGGHQMTATDMGTFANYGAKPINLLANNYGYFGERVTNRYPDES